MAAAIILIRTLHLISGGAAIGVVGEVTTTVEGTVVAMATGVVMVIGVGMDTAAEVATVAVIVMAGIALAMDGGEMAATATVDTPGVTAVKGVPIVTVSQAVMAMAAVMPVADTAAIGKCSGPCDSEHAGTAPALSLRPAANEQTPGFSLTVRATLALNNRADKGIALGATRARIFEFVYRRVGLMLALRLLLGAGITWASQNLIAAVVQVHGTRDLIAASLLIIGFLIAGIVAAFFPASRAASVEPIESLRAE